MDDFFTWIITNYLIEDLINEKPEEKFPTEDQQGTEKGQE